MRSLTETVLCVLATALLACGEDAGSPCGPDTGRVVEVIDGDTVVLEGGERIRYLLADAPESTGGATDCFGPEALAFNRGLVEGRQVTLAYGEACSDRFGRLLAYVSVDGREVNTLLVERGHACVLHVPPRERPARGVPGAGSRGPACEAGSVGCLLAGTLRAVSRLRRSFQGVSAKARPEGRRRAGVLGRQARPERGAPPWPPPLRGITRARRGDGRPPRPRGCIPMVTVMPSAHPPWQATSSGEVVDGLAWRVPEGEALA
ncbi:thermonuclease family protein [Pyxidicoccus sp. 3LG]